MKIIIFSLILVAWMVPVVAQQSYLQERVRFSYDHMKGNTVKDHLVWLENEKNAVISYSSLAIDDQKSIRLEEGVYSMEDFLYRVLKGFEVKLLFSPPSKILIIPVHKVSSPQLYQVSGYIKDAVSREVLIGAVIESKTTKKFSISNSSGFYSFELEEGKHEIEVNYLGYKIFLFALTVNKPTTFPVFLEFQNELPALTISRERVNYWNYGDHVEVFRTKDFKSLLGESDPLTNVKVVPGVQSGGEGQGGLFVRGGGAEQNLILLEGVPLYEVSHTIGIASLFIEESVKDASLIKNGFPARYGGRLSSVLEVNLKEGNLFEHERVISVGLPGAKFHANGPIMKGKTTYNISARTSWVNYYVNKFLVQYTNYDDIRLDYRDVVGKVTHRIAENHKISLSWYSGNDRFVLSKTYHQDSTGYSFQSSDRNRLKWSNHLGSLQWYYTPNGKWSFQAAAGFLNYRHGARSSYVFETTKGDLQNTDELDILSSSNIQTINGKGIADFYWNEKHTFKMGFEILGHVFNPTVKQSAIILEGEEENILDKDSLIVARELNLFLEDHYKILENLSLYAGIHANYFKPMSTAYFSWQPRINLVFRPTGNFSSAVAMTRMRQNIHLLVNLGLGLPSDLWVPSTDKIGPQNAWQWSWTNSWSLDAFHFFQVAGFYKTLDGLLEFQSPIDLFYFFINDTEVVPVYNTARDWERNVVSGKGEAKGLEFLFHRKNKKCNGWFALSWSRSTRTFPDIDQGQSFPFKYDRTWDVNSGITYKVNDHFSFGLNFVYGTGNAFTLSSEEFTTILGTKIINAGTRNNRRLPDFHQLSLNLNYERPFLKNGKWNIHFNIYNVYNRLNAYYIYIYKNPLTKEYLAKKVSILPFTPSIYFSVSF